jgi:hypothetical protein
MQLHPDQTQLAFQHSVQSICAGFIGLDFDQDVGDLMRVTEQNLTKHERDYWQFAHGMAMGDKVLVIAHHFPVAVVTVAGDYNYVRVPAPKLGVWFRHFRAISDPRFFADRVTNAAAWEQYRMTDTISRLVDPTSKSYQLIDSWV